MTIWMRCRGTIITLCTSLFLLRLWSYSHWVPFTGSPIQVVTWSKEWVCGRSLGGFAGSNPTGNMDVLSLVSVVCCQVEVSIGLITRPESPIECGMSECDRKASTMRSLWPTRGLTIYFRKKIPCLLFLKCNQT